MPSYSDIRGAVEPFDIFLFSGEGFISDAIKLATGSEWSHVALSLRLPQYDLNLLYESTTLSDIPDLTTGAKVKGVQMVYLSERIEKYQGGVAWRHVSGPKTDEMATAAARFVREYQGRPYEQNQLDLLAAALPRNWANRVEDASSVFCSELSGLLMQAVGMMPQTVIADSLSPASFAKALPLAKAYTGGEIVRLK